LTRLSFSGQQLSMPGESMVGCKTRPFLSRRLTKTLSTGRFLLVLDDVWSNVAWSNVLSVPVRNTSKNQQGNRVLITTRFEDLALRTRASFYQHHVSPLNEGDPWSMLSKQLPSTPGQVSEHIYHLFCSLMHIIHLTLSIQGLF
jgi:hypothetical protein